MRGSMLYTALRMQEDARGQCAVHAHRKLEAVHACPRWGAAMLQTVQSFRHWTYQGAALSVATTGKEERFGGESVQVSGRGPSRCNRSGILHLTSDTPNSIINNLPCFALLT